MRVVSKLTSALICLLAVGVSPCVAADGGGAEVTTLEQFIVRETAVDRTGDLLPTSRPLSSLYVADTQLVDAPRAVTALTAEVLRQFNITSFADLGRIGAGTQQLNYYGVPGTPILRGAKGSVLFDGMQRAYQLNEMPLSFGSAEAIDVVKGPAPAHFGPALAGGFTNLIPKSPYFDRTRGSVQFTAASHDFYNTQLDVGGPVLLGRTPAAYRVSITGQNAGSAYDTVGNDFISIYAALKAALTPSVTLFTGAEYFDYNSNENAGWNRPTPELIASGRYVIGSPLNIASPAWGGTADRNALYGNPALVVSRAMVDAAVANGFITAAQRSAMNDLATTAGRTAAYGATSPYLNNPNDGYQYTPGYFAAGGKVFTTTIDTGTVLADETDFARSHNLLYFLDLAGDTASTQTWRSQFLLDSIGTDKRSSYGYAMATKQIVLEEKITFTRDFDVGRGMTLTYGPSARYTDAQILQDYFDEPFSRRDISRDDILPTTVLRAGSELGADGLNLWSPTAQGGANVHSRLWQFSLFAYAENRLTDALVTHTSLLVAHAPYRTSYPDEVDRATPAQRAALKVSDERNYYNASFSPVLTLTPGLNLYATGQYGTSIAPTQGGAIFGKDNFARNQLTEAGLKFAPADIRLFANLAIYNWRQAQFDSRAARANMLRGRGVELEVTYAPTPTLTFVASAGWQRVWLMNPLPYRSMPLTEQQWALYGGVFNSQFGPAYFDAANGARPAANPDLIYPGSPETQVKLFARWKLPGGWSVGGGPIINAAYWHNFDHTLRLPSAIIWNLNAGWDHGPWSVLCFAENAFNEGYFYGAEPTFGANTLITKAPGAQFRLNLTRRF